MTRDMNDEVVMAGEELQVGDEVQHRTGKQRMIFIGKDDLGNALCEWTDSSGRPYRESFSIAALKRYEPPSGPAIFVV